MLRLRLVASGRRKETVSRSQGPGHFRMCLQTASLQVAPSAALAEIPVSGDLSLVPVQHECLDDLERGENTLVSPQKAT